MSSIWKAFYLKQRSRSHKGPLGMQLLMINNMEMFTMWKKIPKNFTNIKSQTKSKTACPQYFMEASMEK